MVGSFLIVEVVVVFCKFIFEEWVGELFLEFSLDFILSFLGYFVSYLYCLINFFCLN